MRGARLQDALAGVSEPGALADTAGWWPDLTLERKVELLETIDVEERLSLAVAWARDALAELELTEKIRTEVSDGMEKQQREFLLRRQLDAIRKELGESDDDAVGEYRARLDERDVPDSVREAIVARARSTRAHRRPEPRAGVDPNVARHDPRRAVGHAFRRDPRRR